MEDNNPPFSVQRKTDGELLDSKKEQIFQELLVLANFYLTSNLNTITAGKISEDIGALQTIDNIVTSDKKLSRIQAIIPHLLKLLYKAHNKAISDANRPEKYYDQMVDSRTQFKKIKTILEQ